MKSSGHGSEGTSQVPDFRLVIDSAPALIHTGLPDGYLDFFNQTWLSYVGRSQEDMRGWKWTTIIHPADIEGFVGRWRGSLASGEPFLYGVLAVLMSIIYWPTGKKLRQITCLGPVAMSQRMQALTTCPKLGKRLFLTTA